MVGRTHTHAPHDALVDLGLRLQHYIAAQGKNPHHVAEAMGIAPDDFALALTGHCDLPFSAINTALNVLTMEWWQLFGSDVIHRPRVHDLTLDSDTWHAVDAGLQSFDIRRDSEIFCAGDFLRLHEKLGDTSTDRVLTMQVRYVYHAGRGDGPHGYVIMGLCHPPESLYPKSERRRY